MRKIVSFIVCLSLIASTIVPVFAVTQASTLNQDIIHTSASSARSLSKSQTITYTSYQVNVSQIPQEASVEKATAIERILSVCTVDQIIQRNSVTITLYKSSTLSQYIPDCKEVTEISVFGNHLYISYTATTGKDVILCYDNDGLNDRCVYDIQCDSAFVESAGEYICFDDYRAGASYSMSESLQERIDTLVAAEDWDALSNIDEIIVTISEENLVTIEPYINQLSRAEGISTQAELLSDLKADFPMYSNTVKSTSAKYCNALGEYVNVRVTESRNAYTKKTANYRTFLAGTALTAVATFLGLPASSTILILTAIGVAISAADLLMSAATLYNSAVYTYTGNRIGRVYDSTVHDAYVRVVIYSGKGEFTGGYTSSDEFKWVRSSPCSAYTYEYTDITNTAIYNYNADLVVNGACLTYFP